MGIESDIAHDLCVNFGREVYDSESLDHMYRHTRNLINFYDLKCDVVIYEDDNTGQWELMMEWKSEEDELMDKLKWKTE